MKDVLKGFTGITNFNPFLLCYGSKERFKNPPFFFPQGYGCSNCPMCIVLRFGPSKIFSILQPPNHLSKSPSISFRFYPCSRVWPSLTISDHPSRCNFAVKRPCRFFCFGSFTATLGWRQRHFTPSAQNTNHFLSSWRAAFIEKAERWSLHLHSHRNYTMQ